MHAKYKALFFDVDKTLLDFHATEHHALTRAFQKANLPFTEDMRAFYLEMNGALWESYERGEISRDTVLFTRFGKLFAHFGIEADGVAMEHIYRQELDKGHDLMPYAKAVISNLSKQYPLYIITNGTAQTQHRRLQDSGLKPYFQALFISEEIGSRKPMPEFFRYCLEQLPHLTPADILIIGDSLSSDILGGNLSGIDTCWMNPEQQTNTTTAIPTYEIQSLRMLYDILSFYHFTK